MNESINKCNSCRYDTSKQRLSGGTGDVGLPGLCPKLASTAGSSSQSSLSSGNLASEDNLVECNVNKIGSRRQRKVTIVSHGSSKSNSVEYKVS